MSLRSFVRGDSSVDLESIKSVLSEECGIHEAELSTLDGDNWLSVPIVANDEVFIKILTPQNTLTHSVFTTMRNLGVRVSGKGPFFETYGSPIEMARHEFGAAERMRDIGVRTPRPVDVIEGDGQALILFEYLDGFETLSEAGIDDVTLGEVFGILRHLHDNGLAHGDFSLENVLVVDGDVYFIDSTRVAEDGHDEAVAYDLACAIGAFSSRIPPEDVIEAASGFFDDSDLYRATDFLVIARLRPGIEEGFSVREIRDTIRAIYQGTD